VASGDKKGDPFEAAPFAELAIGLPDEHVQDSGHGLSAGSIGG
jgi:hypothetical protein